MSEMDREFWNESYKGDPEQVAVADRFLVQEVENLSPGTAVDLGCGTGKNALMLAERGWRVTAVDWAEEAIKLARRAAREMKLEVQFFMADTTTWELRQQVDLVIISYALPGGEESRQVLATAVKALAPGGILVVIEWDKSMAEVWHFDKGDLMSPQEIAAALPGLAIEKAEVKQIENPFSQEHDGDQDQSGGQKPSDSLANVALVRARKLMLTNN